MNKEIIDLNNFKNWLRKIKQENNYTAEDLADKIGIAPSTAEGWLYNNKLPNSKYMQQAFNSLGYELQIDGKVVRLDTIYNYLISLIKEQKISNAEFCRRLGFAENYLTMMKVQKQIYPGTLQYILDYYNKTIEIVPISQIDVNEIKTEERAKTIEEYGMNRDNILAQKIIDEASILFKETTDPVVFHEVLWERVIPILTKKEQKNAE